MAFGPFQEPPLSLSSLQEEMGRMLERLWHTGVQAGPFDGQQWGPVVDMYESDDGYALWLELPGVVPEEIDVTHIGHILTVRGEKRRPSVITEAHRPIRTERRYGTFNRKIELPEDCDTNKLSARCQGGLLEISVPKSAASRPKQVKVTAEE